MARGLEALLVKTDDDDASEMPRYPGAVLTGHVLLKGAQAGSVIGLAVAPVGWFAGGRLEPLWSGTSVRYCSRGVGIGILVSGAMLAGKAMTMDEDGVIDRGYRIYQNLPQLRCDAFSGAGALGVAALALAAGAPFTAGTVLRRACQGLGVGVFAYVGEAVYNKSLEKKAAEDSAAAA